MKCSHCEREIHEGQAAAAHADLHAFCHWLIMVLCEEEMEVYLQNSGADREAEPVESE